MRILHASAEYLGLAKTGGLADMVAALTEALHHLGHDIRTCVPAYPGTKERLIEPRTVAQLDIRGRTMDVVEGRLHADGPALWLLDCPPLYGRVGDPYRDGAEREFGDNAERFGCFSEAVALLARGAAGWRPEAVHLHDWHCGLAALWLSRQTPRPRILFTIHNLAYQGIFDRGTFDTLGLPADAWTIDGVEYYGQFSCMKAGLQFSDCITTVSPHYAREIQTDAFGCGLQGVLRERAADLHGIVNGIDTAQWNPARDALIAHTYTLRTARRGKAVNKATLQRELGLAPLEVPLVIFIGRLADQKGADLILAAQERLLALPLQLAILAAGDPALEQRCRELAQRAPERIAVRMAVDEVLAHRLTAAADLQLMPSRFEPCGLNQMYAQRYGTIPVVRRTGGLVDTVTDIDSATLADRSATGILFDSADVPGLLDGLRRGLDLLAAPARHARVRNNGMARDFAWSRSARSYERLYQSGRLGQAETGAVPLAQPPAAPLTERELAAPTGG